MSTVVFKSSTVKEDINFQELSGLKVLVIDDEFGVRETVQSYLTKYDMHVYDSENGLEICLKTFQSSYKKRSLNLSKTESIILSILVKNINYSFDDYDHEEYSRKYLEEFIVNYFAAKGHLENIQVVIPESISDISKELNLDIVIAETNIDKKMRE